MDRRMTAQRTAHLTSNRTATAHRIHPVWNRRTTVLSSLYLIGVIINFQILLAVGLSINRRQTLLVISSSFGIVNGSAKSNAACLSGDLSPSCIGVYKVLPIDDEIKQMISTKEELQKYAPGINFVPPVPVPTTPKLAYETILTQRLAADDIVNVVKAGRLEEAGIKVLNLIPKLTTSGRVLIDNGNSKDKSGSESIQSIRRMQLQNLLETTEVAWNDVDILMGQGIRGDLGVSAVAQLHILSELREATASLDDFLASVKKI